MGGDTRGGAGGVGGATSPGGAGGVGARKHAGPAARRVAPHCATGAALPTAALLAPTGPPPTLAPPPPLADGLSGARRRRLAIRGRCVSCSPSCSRSSCTCTGRAHTGPAAGAAPHRRGRGATPRGRGATPQAGRGASPPPRVGVAAGKRHGGWRRQSRGCVSPELLARSGLVQRR